MTKPNSYSTITMVVCLIYSMSKWISTYSELLPNFGIPPIAAYFWESRFGAYCRRVHNSALLPEDP
ncbi:hypothetical protein Godav_009702, partial [Gossypium davidsonii]|nr:hypothetical protein [Gossypium davidsonii]